MLACLIEDAFILVENAQSELDVGIIAGNLGQILIRLDGLRIILHDLRVTGGDPVFLLRRKGFAQFDRPASRSFGFAVVSQVTFGLGEFGEREGKLRILLS